jgi:hypothetical protein
LKKQILQFDEDMNFQTCDKINGHGPVLKLMHCAFVTQTSHRSKSKMSFFFNHFTYKRAERKQPLKQIQFDGDIYNFSNYEFVTNKWS